MDLMTKRILWYVGITVGLCSLLFFTNIEAESTSQKALFAKAEERKSITFLMGEDKPGYQYFTLAEEHFLYDEEEKTDQLIKSCRSLEDLIGFLNKEQDEVKYSNIQIVLHGNPYNGLSLPISKEGPRATPKNLVKAMLEGKLPRLKSNAIDSLTKINFWGCGIGKNPFINMALDSFFNPAHGLQPEIYTSPHFVIFDTPKDSLIPKRLKASYWPYVYKRGYRPGDREIAEAMRTQFPETEISWKEAIENDDLEEMYRNEFHIPVSWTIIYPSNESRPEVSSEKDKMDWVRSQTNLMDKISETQIPLEKFTWTVNKIIHTKEDGTKVPAIKGIGMATVLCIMDPL